MCLPVCLPGFEYVGRDCAGRTVREPQVRTNSSAWVIAIVVACASLIVLHALIGVLCRDVSTAASTAAAGAGSDATPWVIPTARSISSTICRSKVCIGAKLLLFFQTPSYPARFFCIHARSETIRLPRFSTFGYAPKVLYFRIFVAVLEPSV